jgi:hypothetical protein
VIGWITARRVIGVMAILAALGVLLSDDNHLVGIDLVELTGFFLVLYFVLDRW